MASYLLLSCVLVLALAKSTLGASNTFNYNVSDTMYGPDGWPKTYKDYCGGTSQSPINIATSGTGYDASLDKLTLTKFDTVPNGTKFKVTNNGHTFEVLFASNQFQVSGGGLPGTFTTLQFHFHWGGENAYGSEHTVDGKRYPAELHIVNFNNKYKNISEAVKHSDGLAVLGVIFKVGTTENPALTSFLNYAGNVTKPSAVTNLPMTHNLASLLPPNTTDFYRYNGSLTTPGCNEVVTWTVFKNYATITTTQLDMLRSLKENNSSSLIDNFRPTQPLNSRYVTRSFMTKADINPDNGAYQMTGTKTTCLSIAMAMFLLIK